MMKNFLSALFGACLGIVLFGSAFTNRVDARAPTLQFIDRANIECLTCQWEMGCEEECYSNCCNAGAPSGVTCVAACA